MNPQNSTLFHYHNFMELVFIESGQGIHFTGTESYPITAGDAFVIRKHDAHGYSNTNNLRLINVLFYPNKLALPLKELDKLRGYHALFKTKRSAREFYGLKSHLCLDLKQLTYIEGLISSLEQELKDKKAGFSFTAKALFMLIICDLSRYYEDQQILAQSSVARISNAIAYIEANYAKQIRPADLASTVHMSLRNLYRYFKSATGLSPVEYLIRLRVMRGAELLRQGQLNVTETAFLTGFNDSNYFSRKFHEVMGLRPRQFILCPNIRVDKPKEDKAFTASRQALWPRVTTRNGRWPD
ncbi:MAG: helix-turn-helix domain-containing protein [Kiritimatiellia bacterium]|nr:helix-turn-helix domain-containing protein [Kiritimatiellia bacterium]